MGGDLILTNVGANQYEIRLTEYRDTLGIPLYTYETIQQYSYDVLTNTYTLDSTYDLNLNTALSTTLLPSFPYGVEVGVFNDTLSLPSGQYRFVMSSCCRNAAILNMTDPGSESMVLYTDLTVDVSGGNSSPTFLAMPVAYFPINDTVVYNPLPYDADGDSLVWSLNTPYTADTGAGTGFTTVVGFTAPSADPAGPFTMNPINGEITWIPNQLGNWVQSFIIDEYRNGVKIGSVVRDFQYVIVEPDSNNQNAPQFMVNNSNVNYNAAQGYNWMYYYASQPLTFEIGGNDLDANATLELNSFSEIFMLPVDPATFNVANTGASVTGTLNWTPDATFDKDVILVFRLRDGMWTKDYTLLLTKNNNTSVGSTSSADASIVAYPNPVTSTLNVDVNLAKDMNGDIAMFSAIGQKVTTFQAGKLTKGTHHISQNINLASGMYYLVVRDGNKIVKTVPVAVK